MYLGLGLGLGVGVGADPRLYVYPQTTVPYTVYAPEDETGLVHDHLWALIERGAALLQVRRLHSVVYLLMHG